MDYQSRIAKPGELLRGAEAAAPTHVERAHRFLLERGIWFRLARNSPATSCRDAAHRRERLGTFGIPLWDELKSFALTDDGSRLVLLHCRADAEFDLDAACEHLGLRHGSLERADSLLADLRVGYGLVNPFTTWDDESVEVRQVFDHGVLSRLGTPGTMMTNAGDSTWAVEFYGDELVDVLDGASVASIIASPAPVRPGYAERPAKIGIVTGNSPESGMALWENLLATVRGRLGRANRGDVSMPAVEVTSIPGMGLSMELDHRLEPVHEIVRSAVAGLAEAGATHVGVACNTTQYYSPSLTEVAEAAGAEFLSMPEAVASWLRAEGIDQVGLVGIDYVSDLGEWSAYGPALRGIEVEIPDDRGHDRIEELAYQVKAEGPSTQALGRLRNVLRDAMDSKYVVLALTELSILLELQSKRSKGDQVLVDPLRIYGEALAARFLGLPFPLPEPAETD